MGMIVINDLQVPEFSLDVRKEDEDIFEFNFVSFDGMTTQYYFSKEDALKLSNFIKENME